MLTHPTVAKLEHMRLFGMANALRDQLVTADMDELTFTDRLALMVDNEMAVRDSRRLAQRLGRARLKHQASVADIDYGQGRGLGLDKHLMLHLASCQWVRRHQNIVITGATGVGKSYLACAFAHKACLENFRAQYHRLPRLMEDLQIAHADGRYQQLLNKLAKMDVLVLDDWSLGYLSAEQQRHLLELLDDRYDTRSTIATSQYPVEQWHETMEDPTLADAVLDRLIHNAHKIELVGESMRKKKSLWPSNTPQKKR